MAADVARVADPRCAARRADEPNGCEVPVEHEQAEARRMAGLRFLSGHLRRPAETAAQRTLYRKKMLLIRPQL